MVNKGCLCQLISIPFLVIRVVHCTLLPGMGRWGGGAGNAFKNENFLYKREMYALLLGI